MDNIVVLPAKMGRPIGKTKPGRNQLAFSVPAALKDALIAAARDNCRSLSSECEYRLRLSIGGAKSVGHQF
tara:strand:+ start:1341 stop:1553 length:213 start_codon:yes stop_codon:yes gene_type:complete